jgi:pyruvate dehydrogenase (quinone)/pyruvate oxidase
MNERGSREDKPMKPQVVAHALGELLPDNAIVSCDSGTITAWWARHIPAKAGQMHSVSGNLASMACALPYSIAAQIAYPDRPCIAFVGDGGFSMLMAEFATAVKYKLPIKVVVIKNLTLGQIKWEQIVFLGNPEYGCDLHDIDFTRFAEACGGVGVRIEDPITCRDQLAKALAIPGPVLIEAVVDKLEPPMPPEVTMEQTLRFTQALARGEQDGGKILSNVIKERIRELV